MLTAAHNRLAYLRCMNILNVPMIVALGGALIVMGCDRDRPPTPETTAAATAPRPPAPVSDPSLPSAATAVGDAASAAPTAQDNAATQPMKEMSKQEESTAMPKANQANNHSSTALDPKTNKP